MAETNDSIVAHLQHAITSFKTQVQSEPIGTVVESSDGIVKATGLADVKIAEMVKFDNGVQGVVLNLEEGSVGIMVMGEFSDIHEGMKVTSLGKILQVPVGDELIGRVVNTL